MFKALGSLSFPCLSQSLIYQKIIKDLLHDGAVELEEDSIIWAHFQKDYASYGIFYSLYHVSADRKEYMSS
jgi:hypothetical protein